MRSPTKVLVLFLLTVACATLGVRWFADGSGGPQTLDRSAGAARASATDGSAPEDGSAPGDGWALAVGAAGGEGRRALEASEEPRGVVGDRAHAFDLSTIRVVCVDAASGAPVPDARVFVADFVRDEAPRVSTSPRPIATIRERGTEHRADANGVVVLPRPVRTLTVAAVSGGRSGLARIDLPVIDGVATVELAPTRELEIRVVDEGGEPVPSVDLWLGAYWANDAGERMGGEARLLDATSSDGSDGPPGRVVVEWSAILPRYQQKQRRVGFVEAETIPAGRHRVTFDADAPPIEPIELVVEDHGRIVVEVRDAEGGVALGPARVTVSEPGTHRRLATATTVDGRAVFERVALGRTWKLEVETPSALWPIGDRPSVLVDGPTESEREVTATLDLDAALLVGRAVDEEGVPFSDRRLIVGRGADSMKRTGLTTDGSGRFVLRRDDWVQPGSTGDEVRFTMAEFGSVDGRSPRSGEVVYAIPVAASATARTVDLGDVVLAEAEPLVSGRVVDTLGAPVPRVGVQVLVRANGEWASFTSFVESPVPASVFTDDDGRFAIHAAFDERALFEADEIALSVASDGFAILAPVPFRPGDELELVVQRRGRIEGRVAGIASDDAFDFWVVAFPMDPHAPVEWRRVEDFLDREGRFGFDVAAGDWDLELFHEPGDRSISVATLAGVRVEPTRRATDPRLEPWTTPLRRIEVSVVDAAGDAIDDGTVTIDHGDSGVTEAWIGYGSFAFHTAVAEPSAWIRSEGYLDEVVRAPRDGHVVTLEAAPSIELALSAPVHGEHSAPTLDPESRQRLGIVLEFDAPALDEVGGASLVSEPFAALPATVPVGHARALGRWSVFLEFMPDGRRSTATRVGTIGSIDVRAGRAEQRFELEVPSAVLDELRRLIDEP